MIAVKSAGKAGGAVAVDDDPRAEAGAGAGAGAGDGTMRWMLLIVTCSEEVAGCCSWIVMGAEMRHVGRLGR